MFHFLRRGNRPPIAESGVALASLTHDLQALFTTLYNPPPGRPPAYDWAGVSTQRQNNVAVKTTGSPSRPSWLTGSLVAGAAAVVLTAAGYAAVTGTGLSDRMFANFGDTPSREGIHRVGLSQTIDGITVTVDHVVLDETPIKELNVSGSVVEYVPILVQFTVSGLPGGDRRAYSLGASLSSDGVELKSVGGVGLRGHSDILGRGLPPGAEQTLVAYDTTGVGFESGRLALRLEVRVVRRADQNSQDGGHEVPGEVTPGEEAIGPPTLFSFEFSVPAN